MGVPSKNLKEAMSDPNSYAINTSTLPVYVLPPEQYTQINQGQSVVYANANTTFQPLQTYPPQQQVFVTNPGDYGAPPPQYNPVQTVPTHVTTQGGPNPTRELEISIASRDSVPSMCDCISGAFSLYGKYCCHFFGWTILGLGFMTGLIISALMPVLLMLKDGKVHHPNPVMYLVQIIISLVLVPFGASISYATLQMIRTEDAGTKGADWIYTFKPHMWLGLIVLQFLMNLIVGFGMLLLIIPGIYLAVGLCLSQLLYLEFHNRGLGVMQCMTLSRQVVGKNWCWWFGFLLTIGLISIIPFLFPVSMIALALAFRESVGLFETHDSGSFSLGNSL